MYSLELLFENLTNVFNLISIENRLGSTKNDTTEKFNTYVFI